MESAPRKSTRNRVVIFNNSFERILNLLLMGFWLFMVWTHELNSDYRIMTFILWVMLTLLFIIELGDHLLNKAEKKLEKMKRELEEDREELDRMKAEEEKK